MRPGVTTAAVVPVPSGSSGGDSSGSSGGDSSGSSGGDSSGESPPAVASVGSSFIGRWAAVGSASVSAPYAQG
ncbi:hypothetical protein BRC92_09945 [Halobacteriales archaeon QS_4_69_31]|nr:MAG: hypothetical protein BRC92_09945 [Halobacteriales archaeon QS_4_69_31]